MATPSNSSPTNTDAAPAPKRTRFESVILLTPVILTVVATVLAGRSAAEMTLCQYYRSVAGQNQAKAGDQWAFFQAKKIRGTEMEMNLDRAPVSVKPASIEPSLVQLCGERLQLALEDAGDRAKALEKASQPALAEAAKKFTANLKLEKKTPSDLQQQLSNGLNHDQERKDKTGEAVPIFSNSVFAYFNFDPRNLPKADPVKEEYLTALNNEEIKAVITAIVARQPEHDIAELCKKINVLTLRQAIDGAEAQGQAFEKKCDPYVEAIKYLNDLTAAMVQQASASHRLALEVSARKVDDMSQKDAVDKFLEADRSVQVAAQELNDLTKTASQDFNQRRYGEEARNNQNTASYYEVQVHYSSMLSDNHLERSKLFSYAMMATQAAVAIASLALAARRKSLLWLLAACLGLAALCYSYWVFRSTNVH